jgi:hypothetical protein
MIPAGVQEAVEPPLQLSLLAGRMGWAFLFGVLIAWRPLSRLCGGRASRPEIAHALLLMTLAATLVISIIGDSLARAFGVVGLGSFIRFRASIKDPSDVVLFFIAIGMGMACGLGMVLHAAIGLGVLSVVLVARDRMPAPVKAPKPAAGPAAGLRESWKEAAP